MRNPSISRSNSRHRGPMESAKLNKQVSQTLHSIHDLYEILNSLKAEAQTFLSDARDGNEAEGITGGNQMSYVVSQIRKEARYMKGGVPRG